MGDGRGLRAAGEGVIAGQASAVAECETAQSDRFVGSDIFIGDRADTSESECLSAHQTAQREDVCVHVCRAVVGARAGHADHIQRGGVNGQIPAGEVIALLVGIIAVVKTRVGSAGGGTQHIGNEGEGRAALGCAVVSYGSIRCAGERQGRHESGEQGCGVAFVDAPGRAAAAGVGDGIGSDGVPASKAG